MKKTLKIIGLSILIFAAILFFDYQAWDGTCTSVSGDAYPCDWQPLDSLVIMGILTIYLAIPLSFAGIFWLLVTLIHYLTGQDTKHPRDSS